MPLWQRYRRVPGEPSTFKEPPGSAMESESGSCKRGGMHLWRYGRCAKCGLSEGAEQSNLHREASISSNPRVIAAGAPGGGRSGNSVASYLDSLDFD